MEIAHDGLTVCHDCACWLANGEGDEMTAESFEAGMQRWSGYDVVLACGGEDDESECESTGWFACAVCDVSTFGTGHPAVTFRREQVAYVSRPGDGQVRVVGTDSTVTVLGEVA